ncbi:hypothetical protein HQ587_10030 [bacterium]|nr:hypothetical protein [bacterium]
MITAVLAFTFAVFYLIGRKANRRSRQQKRKILDRYRDRLFEEDDQD